MPDWVNFVVIFDAFTGLQCRFQDYLYLIAYLVFSSEPTPVPCGAVFVGSSSDFAGHIIGEPDI